jgi:hypothetical protein
MTDNSEPKNNGVITLRHQLNEVNFLLYYKELMDHLPVFGDAGKELHTLKTTVKGAVPKRQEEIKYKITNKDGQETIKTRNWNPAIDEPAFREQQRAYEVKEAAYQNQKGQLWRFLTHNLTEQVKQTVQLDKVKYMKLRGDLDTLGLFIHIKEIVEKKKWY